eukprot:1155565-Pelagomonas_calceolata.AAC.3
MQPAFRDKDRRANVALYVAKQPLTANDPMDAPAADGDAEYVELPISAHSKAAVVAGGLQFIPMHPSWSCVPSCCMV